MAHQTLSQFAKAKRTKGYISFSDVRLLEREIVPNGIDSPDVAETLLSMDRLVAAAHPAWAGFLVAAVLAYLEGMTDEATQDHRDVARRLVAWLSTGNPRSVRSTFVFPRIGKSVDPSGAVFDPPGFTNRQSSSLRNR